MGARAARAIAAESALLTPTLLGLTLVWIQSSVFGPDSLYQRAGSSLEALQRCIGLSHTPRRHLNIFMGPSSCTLLNVESHGSHAVPK